MLSMLSLSCCVGTYVQYLSPEYHMYANKNVSLVAKRPPPFGINPAMYSERMRRRCTRHTVFICEEKNARQPYETSEAAESEHDRRFSDGSLVGNARSNGRLLLFGCVRTLFHIERKESQ